MKPSKQALIWGLAILVIALAIILVFVFRQTVPEAKAPDNVYQTGYEHLEWNVNSEGHKWAIADQADFIVSGGDETGIKFWEGKIDPLKVVPGMTQTMRIVVSSPNGLASVTAEIETDNGINNVELQKTGVLAARDLSDRHGVYVIQEDGVLAINNDEEARAWRLALVKQEESRGLVPGAMASNGEREVWEGSWIVYDTSVRDYTTTFVARDSAGQENSMAMAWSDPCKQDSGGSFWPNSGNAILSDACGIATVYGVDSGNLQITSLGTLTLNAGAILAFNQGHNISIQDGGRINILNGGSIQKKYLWAVDKDGDGYIDVNHDMTRWVGDSASVAPNPGQQSSLKKFFAFLKPAQAQVQSDLKRQSTIVSHATDCYDDNINARPGQSNYFGTHRGDGSFDYDCNGSATREIEYVCLMTESYCDEFIPEEAKTGYLYDIMLTDRTGRVYTDQCWQSTNPSSPVFPSCGNQAKIFTLGQTEGCYVEGELRDYYIGDSHLYNVPVGCK